MSNIFNLPEATGVSNNDYVHIASPTLGDRKIKVKKLVGDPILTTKNITQNGTYSASSDNADGYSQVIVNIAGIVESITQNNYDLLSQAEKMNGNAYLIENSDKIYYLGVEYINNPINYLYNWDFTQSLNDLVQNEPATLNGSGIYRDSSGVTISDNASYIKLTNSSIFQAGKTYEIDFGNMTPNFSSNAYLFGVSNNNGKGFLYHRTMGWAANKGGINYYTTGTTCYDKEIFENKTLKAICTSTKFLIYAVDKALGTELEIFNAENCVDSTPQIFNIGMGYYNMTVKAARVYNNL